MSGGRILTADDIEFVSKTLGIERTQKILSSMGKSAPMLQALSSETGRVICTTVIDRIDKNVGLLISGDVKPGSDEDNLIRAELRVCRSLLTEWTNILRQYNGAKNEFDKALGK